MPVLVGVVLCRFVMVMLGVEMVTVSGVSVVGGLLVFSRFVVLGSLLVMMRRVLAVFGRVLVVV